jgi:hypothetical protein
MVHSLLLFVTPGPKTLSIVLKVWQYAVVQAEQLVRCAVTHTLNHIGYGPGQFSVSNAAVTGQLLIRPQMLKCSKSLITQPLILFGLSVYYEWSHANQGLEIDLIHKQVIFIPDCGRTHHM